MSQPPRSIAIIGATGQLGGALARRLVKAGASVIVGSRDAARARAAAASLENETQGRVAGASNAEAAAAADVVIVTVPFAAQKATLREIAPHVSGKIVIDTTVPLMPPKVMRVQLPAEGSAAQIASEFLGASARVVAAFHNVPAHKLATDEKIDCDVLVFGDDPESRDAVIRIAESCGLRALHAGPLANSAAAEALTSVLIFMNKRYAVDGAGIRITGALSASSGRPS
ncbi:MAG TPA: NADPH-dependent F420 reductase [Steroidobacteraceae bacterium]|nr:NADPH-dependent F420 reductase [Steroidobacteraceae bacterium]